jgi:hypothetical protein
VVPHEGKRDVAQATRISRQKTYTIARRDTDATLKTKLPDALGVEKAFNADLALVSHVIFLFYSEILVFSQVIFIYIMSVGLKQCLTVKPDSNNISRSRIFIRYPLRI